jgi:hypothetical protein
METVGGMRIGIANGNAHRKHAPDDPISGQTHTTGD